MSTSAFVGNSDGMVTGLCPAPPPPPPPPPVPGQVPAMRIDTVQAPTIRRPQIVSNDAYEPPAAIQNAMLTKDKKPFTYTPGMGGKLDLSQIRSPRMARRVAKNANDEGIEGPPKSALEPKPTPATNAGANLFVQPQVAIPVFPTNVPVQQNVNRTPPTPTANRTPPTPPVNRIPPAPEKQPEPIKVVTKIETKASPNSSNTTQPSSPESPSTPTQVTLAKAPTPWLQNKNKPQEELPEWAKRSSLNKQSSSPESPTSPPVYVAVQQAQPQQQPPPQWQQTQLRQQQPQQWSQQQQPQQFNQQRRPYSSPATQQSGPQTQERVIPIRIEDRPSVFDAKHDGGHHQFKQPSNHHQQRWGQPPPQTQVPNQVQHQPPQAQPTTGGAFIVPIMVEGSERKPTGGPVSNTQYSQPIVRNNTPVVENQTVKIIPQRGPVQVQQSEPGPVQSRSFRVLQKITDTDSNDLDTEQVRKLQLTDDDRVLMNKFKEQVDNESSLHHEEDPRYRGAAIPSRAFRFLQTMTESGDVPVMNTGPRTPSAINKKQNRNSKTFEETQANLPPSEQQVPEPKKYMGGAIPSRSFRILQAMTAPESVATQENRQADYTCQSENNVPGNQQGGVFLPPYPPPFFWSPGGGWWGYYPLPYPAANDSYHSDNTAYVYFPIYGQGYAGCCDPSNSPGKNNCPSVYRSYVLPVPPCNNFNHVNEQVVNGAVAPIEANDIADDIKDETREKDIEKLGGNQWAKVARAASSESKYSDCTTAMNITDEEEIPDAIGALETKEERSLETKVSLNVGVPNYTYIDTSDSSDSSDTDNESIVESAKSSSDNNVENSSSDSDDSDSYLAYSTGLNPHGRLDEEKKDDVNGGSNTDSEGEQLDEDNDKTTANAFPHKLSVIYEDVERPDSISPRPEATKTGKRNEAPSEATDDPPDESGSTTVSVSLPLRFRFSVSENNEDVTTVIVGDSTIKPEKRSKDESRCLNVSEQKRSNDVSANFLVNNDTSVDFTVKKENVEGKRRSRSNSNEKNEDPVVPQVNFTLRKIPTRFGRINCEETVETEFTVKRKTRKEEKTDDKAKGKLETSSETHDFNRNILKPEVIVSECKEASSETRNSKTEEKIVKPTDIPEKEEKTKEPKDLLSVQNSREETDDEDSGVTSDMSRMISEVDTDSECTSYRNMRKYSRLFKLLNDDSILAEGTENDADPNRRKYLGLPLSNNSFVYDENYYSNYSSGLASPEEPPLSESWRRLHDTDQNGDTVRYQSPSCKEDPYYQTWKTSKSGIRSYHDACPSLAFKVLENRRPLWSYRVNVLCPRIKSTKNVPETLRKSETPVTPNPSPFATLNTDHC